MPLYILCLLAGCLVLLIGTARLFSSVVDCGKFPSKFELLQKERLWFGGVSVVLFVFSGLLLYQKITVDKAAFMRRTTLQQAAQMKSTQDDDHSLEASLWKAAIESQSK